MIYFLEKVREIIKSKEGVLIAINNHSLDYYAFHILNWFMRNYATYKEAMTDKLCDVDLFILDY